MEGTGGGASVPPLFAPESPVLFVSPHLDDAVLSCASWLARNPGATVVTVVAGAPDIDNPPDTWHARTTGARHAPDGVALRREEDARALASLGASWRHLEFWDVEYLGGGDQDTAAVARALAAVVEELTPASVVLPLGIHHRDHVAIGEACLSLGTWHERATFIYADLPYAVAFPDEATHRLARVAEVAHEDGGGSVQACAPVPACGTVKVDTARLYASQYEPLRHDEDYSFAFDDSMVADERYWRIVTGVEK